MRILSGVAACVLLLAGCADQALAPAAGFTGPAVTTDSASYQLATYSHDGLTYFLFHGTATFRNITNKTIYVDSPCHPGIGVRTYLQRPDGTTVPNNGVACPLIGYASPGQATPIAPGDSIESDFGVTDVVKDSLAAAELPRLVGSARVVFAMLQIVPGKAVPQPVPVAYTSSAAISILAP